MSRRRESRCSLPQMSQSLKWTGQKAQMLALPMVRCRHAAHVSWRDHISTKVTVSLLLKLFVLEHFVHAEKEEKNSDSGEAATAAAVSIATAPHGRSTWVEPCLPAVALNYTIRSRWWIIFVGCCFFSQETTDGTSGEHTDFPFIMGVNDVELYPTTLG